MSKFVVLSDIHANAPALEAEIAATFADYARSEEIPLNELSDTEIHQLATGFVKRGFGE